MILKNSLYPKKRRRNESKLKVHIDSLIDMHTQGYSLVMMEEYLASFDIKINTTTIWRYLKKQITRYEGLDNLIVNINASNVYSKKIEPSLTLNHHYYTDDSKQKSTLQKLNDLSSTENEF